MEKDYNFLMDTLLKQNKDYLVNLRKLREKKDKLLNNSKRKYAHSRSSSISNLPGHELSIMENTIDLIKSNNEPERKKTQSMKIPKTKKISKRNSNEIISNLTNKDLFEKDKSNQNQLTEINNKIDIKIPKAIIRIEPTIDINHLHREMMILKNDCKDINSKKILDSVIDNLEKLEKIESHIFIKREENILEQYDENHVIRLQRMIRRWINKKKSFVQSKKNIDHLKQRRDMWLKFLASEKSYFINIFTLVTVYLIL